MDNEDFRLFNDKIGITELGIIMEGDIAIPEAIKVNKDFRLGRVVKTSKAETRLVRVEDRVVTRPNKMYVEEGDAVLFQIPISVTKTSGCQVKGYGEVSIIVQSDALAKFKTERSEKIIGEEKLVAKLENLTALGDWLLLDAKCVDTNEESIIKRPDTAPDITTFRFDIIQLGYGGDWDEQDYKVGDTVFVERMRATPFWMTSVSKLSGLPTIEEYYFLHKNDVLGKFI
jgi:hypothetical protein